MGEGLKDKGFWTWAKVVYQPPEPKIGGTAFGQVYESSLIEAGIPRLKSREVKNS